MNVGPMKKPKLLRISTVPQTLFRIFQPQLNYLKTDFEICTVCGPFDQDVHDVYGKWPYKHFEINLSRQIAPFKDLKAIQQLVQILKSERVTIVHSHTPKAGLIGMIAAKTADVPIKLHTVAGMPLEESTGTKRFLLSLSERITYSLADKVYPNSYGMRDAILNNGLASPDKLKIIGHGGSIGVDASFFDRTPDVLAQAGQLMRDNGFQEDDTICIFIGRLTRQKGLEELIEAFSSIFAREPNVKLLLLGRYEQHLDPVSEACIQTIKKHPRIIHFGYVNDVRPYLAISHMLVFPSYREGMPNVVLQAGCFSIPSVVTDISGSREVIQDGKNGFVVPAKDSIQFRDATLKLINSTDLRRRMGLEARRRVVERYSQQAILSELAQEYKKLLHEKGL